MSNKKETSTDEAIITIYTENGVQNIRPEQFPEIIKSSIERMEELSKKYKEAQISANAAKNQVNSAKKVADDAKNSAVSVVNKSNEVNNMNAGLFHRKAAIEGLQEGHVELAKSQKGIADVMMQLTDVQGSLAKAQSDTMDAFKVSFEFDKDISNITKYLFLLGCSSIAASQNVCRIIEMKLQNASEEEISEYARSELKSVVDNLKAQENMMQRQKQIEDDLDIYIEVVNSNKEKISEHEQKLISQAKEIQRRIDKEKELTAKQKEQNEQLKKQREVDQRHESRLNTGDEHDKEQDEKIKEQVRKGVERDHRLDAEDEKNAEQDATLAMQSLKDEEHDRRLSAGEQKDEQQDETINGLKSEMAQNKQAIKHLTDALEELERVVDDSKKEVDVKVSQFASKEQVYIAGAIGILSLLAAIVQFFI